MSRFLNWIMRRTCKRGWHNFEVYERVQDMTLLRCKDCGKVSHYMVRS